MSREDVESRARRIRLVTLDVDGVLTDGRIYVDDHGREMKAFSALDGQGIKMLQDAGIAVAWITGSIAPVVAHRARHLGIAHVISGAADKRTPWNDLRARLQVPAEACAHVGDDLPDVPLLAACGLAVTVPHATEGVRRHAHYVTSREGGAGAVREVAELILAAQDLLDAAEAPHVGPAGGP
ncbi:MAG TPA: HAD-IIIA family hydrolase [Casimicrobiaceae bacterium]|nr:HAD-IIIA family hydrolase [Casimicrobiaceae bacterium]